MSTRRVATISFGIALVSAAGMALAAEPKTPCNEDAMIVFDASDSRSGTVALGIVTPASPGRHSPRRCNRRPRGSTTNTSLGSSSWSPTAKRPAGTHLAAETEEDLVEALDKTLGCPMVTQRLEAMWLASWAASHHDF